MGRLVYILYSILTMIISVKAIIIDIIIMFMLNTIFFIYNIVVITTYFINNTFKAVLSNLNVDEQTSSSYRKEARSGRIILPKCPFPQSHGINSSADGLGVLVMWVRYNVAVKVYSVFRYYEAY